jgi:hypothetical protein
MTPNQIACALAPLAAIGFTAVLLGPGPPDTHFARTPAPVPCADAVTSVQSAPSHLPGTTVAEATVLAATVERAVRPVETGGWHSLGSDGQFCAVMLYMRIGAEDRPLRWSYDPQTGKVWTDDPRTQRAVGPS